MTTIRHGFPSVVHYVAWLEERAHEAKTTAEGQQTQKRRAEWLGRAEGYRIAAEVLMESNLFPQVTAITWKHEDEIDGQMVGPMKVWREGDERGPRPFDPDREPEPWVTLAHARSVAQAHGMELEES